jgi:hypothetical protein
MMPEASILQHLEACGALVDVQLGGHLTLEPKEHIHAVSSQLFRGEHCFVLMGASHGSAISMARIAAIETIDLEVVKRQPRRISTDVDYMVSIRSVLGAYLQRPELFFPPVACLFTSDLDDPWCTIIQQRISTVLQHLHIELKVGPGYLCSGAILSTLSPDHSCSVTAICHPEGLCEVYVDERLAVPNVRSGVLTWVRENLKLRKPDCEASGHEHGELREDGTCSDRGYD